MKKYMRLTALAMALMLMFSGCSKKGQDGPGGEGGGPGGMPMGMEEQGSTATAVKTQTLELSSISNEYMYSGSIQPSDEVNVNSTLSGKVAMVNFDVGDEVKAGDVLFTMDTTSIQNSVKVAEASVESAKTSVATAENNLKMANGASMQTQIENAKNSITSAQTSVKNAKTSVTNAQVSLDNSKISLEKAEKDYNTSKQLYEAGGLSEDSMNDSKDAYDKAKNAYTQAELSLEQANTQYTSAQDSLTQAQTNYDILVNQTSQENVTKAQDSLNQAKAQLASSEAQLNSSKQNLEDAVVKAPISGTISQCNVTAGASLSQGTSPFVIIGTNSVDIKVNVAEQMINSIKAGDEVRITIPTISSENFTGNISSVSPDANSDGTYEVKINVPNPTGELKSGMFAEVYFTKEKSDNAIVIPRDSVITKDGESYVYVVEGTTAKKCTVEIGIDNGDTVEITSGLSAGMTIVTEGQTYLVDGDTVNDVTNKSVTSKSTEPETGSDSEQAPPQDSEQMPAENRK
jgi:RND family efflux transporter MFP subunit